jgi:DNA-binding MarR family transcriptional regulator
MTSNPSSPELVELATLVPRFFSQMVNHSASDTLALMNDHNLSMAQVVTLRALQAYGPHSVFDVSDRLHLSRAATSHLVDRLVHEGLVDREESLEDRRQKRVTLSQHGLELVEKLDRARAEAVIAGLQKLSPEAQKAVAAALDMIMQDIRTAEACAKPMRTERSK